MKRPLNEKSNEAAIDKVLGGLRETEAPEGLEQRILRRVAEREAAPQPAWRLLWTAIPGCSRSLAYGLAVAALIAGGVALVAVRRPARTPLDSAALRDGPGSSGIRPTHRGDALRWMGHPGGLAASENRMTRVLGDGQQKTVHSKVVSGVRQPVTPEDTEDAQALSDTLAASHPAPPMPLTEQERLLLKIAHTGDPEELAALNPELRDRALAKGAVDFRAFFPPPPPLVVER